MLYERVVIRKKSIYATKYQMDAILRNRVGGNGRSIFAKKSSSIIWSYGPPEYNLGSGISK